MQQYFLIVILLLSVRTDIFKTCFEVTRAHADPDMCRHMTSPLISVHHIKLSYDTCILF